MARLTWSKDKRPTGLASVGCGLMSHTLKHSGMEMAKICPLDRYSDRYWYWHTLYAKPHFNSCNDPRSFEECKISATAYVREYLLSTGGK